MENLHTYITNIRRSYQRVDKDNCVWEQFVLTYSHKVADTPEDTSLHFLISSLYVRGGRKIESHEPGKIYFHFLVDKNSPTASVTNLLSILNEDLLGFTEMDLKIIPVAFFENELIQNKNEDWMEKFNFTYKDILKQLGKVFIHQLPIV